MIKPYQYSGIALNTNNFM
jgi:replication-associated recombination protein RarA